MINQPSEQESSVQPKFTPGVVTRPAHSKRPGFLDEKSLLQKHWYGEYSLSRTFWLHYLVVSDFIFGSLISTWLTYRISGAPEAGWPLLAAQITAWGILVFAGVGVWRSSDRYVKAGGSQFWALSARAFVALGVAWRVYYTLIVIRLLQ